MICTTTSRPLPCELQTIFPGPLDICSRMWWGFKMKWEMTPRYHDVGAEKSSPPMELANISTNIQAPMHPPIEI